MRTIILSIFISLSGWVLYAQMPTNGDYSNWDWEDQSQQNWRSQHDDGWVNIKPPFLYSTERVGDMVDVHSKGDYTRAKGWELVWAQFDEYPYFILYNRQRSIVRAFFYLENIPFTEVLTTLSFHDEGCPAILAFGNEYQRSTQDYYNGTASANDDMISVIIRNLAPNSWGVADFPILFDNYIRYNKYKNKRWVFNFYGCNNYKLKISGNDPLTQSLLSGQQTITSSKNAVAGNTFNADYAKVHKQIQSIDKFLQEMQNSTKNIGDDAPGFLKSYKSIVTDLKGVSSIASAVSGLSSGFSAVLGFFNLITGTFAEDAATKPVTSIQSYQLTGDMNIQQVLGGNTLSIPGTPGTFYPSGTVWTPFNCPMGIINLQYTPQIRKTTPYERYGYYLKGGYYGYDENNVATKILLLPGYPQVLLIGNPPPLQTGYAQKYPGKFVKYKLDADITLTTQTIPGLALEDVQFAIVCKPNGTGDRKYSITDRYLAYHAFYDLNGRRFDIPSENPVYKALEEGRFIVHKYGESDDIYFGTPFMDKDQLKGVVVEVPEDTDVKLGVVARFHSDQYDEPIIFKACYNMNPVEETALTKRVFFAQEQQSFPFSEFYNTYSTKTLNSPNSQQHTATCITLSPGFVGNPGFVATAQSITKGLQNGNTIINVVNFNCGNALGNMPAPMRKSAGIIDEGIETTPPVLYPNPTTGIIRIDCHEEEINSISLYDMSGKTLLSVQSSGQHEEEIDMSRLPDGPYIMVVRTMENTYSERIILNK